MSVKGSWVRVTIKIAEKTFKKDWKNLVQKYVPWNIAFHRLHIINSPVKQTIEYRITSPANMTIT